MSKEQFTAINTYCLVRFGNMNVSVYLMFNIIQADAYNIKCDVDDVINAFINYDVPDGECGFDVVKDIVEHYLKYKTAKAIGNAYEEAVEEVSTVAP